MSGRLVKILEMIRFSHTLFALPFALLASVMAWLAPADRPIPSAPAWRQFLGILLCMVFARSAAMAFNRLVDHRIDSENPRTASRHLPRGLLSPAVVALFTAVNTLLFIASAALFLPNVLPVILAGPVIVALFGYSYTKRFTSLAHFYLGASLMAAPVCAWIAIRGPLLLVQPLDLLPAATLGLAILAWVAGFDIIYACQDADFDRRASLHSVPARLGVARALRVAAICHAIMVGLLAALPFTHYVGGPELGLGMVYGAGVLAVAGLLIYEHRLVRPNDLTRVNMAFFNVNSVISIGLFVVGTVDLVT